MKAALSKFADRVRWRATRPLARPNYPGTIDWASPDLIAGWANHLEGVRQVDIAVGPALRERVPAETPRGDLAEAGFHAAGAFHFEIPGSAYPIRGAIPPTEVRVRHAATGRHLIGSPTWVFAQPPARNALNVFSVLFFDAKGAEFLHGGAERYIIDLAHLARVHGLTTRVYQASDSGFWVQTYGSIEVRGIPWDFRDLHSLSMALHEHSERAVLNLYSPFALAMTACHRPAIGISHGVFWDAPHSYFPQNEVAVLSGLLHCDQTISVDTNTINFIRAVRGDLSAKMSYVPNYVGDEFFGTADAAHGTRDGRVVVGFPRRLYDPRGFALLEDVIPDLIASYDRVDFRLIGGISETDRPRLDQLLSAYRGRVVWEQRQPAEMPAVYPELDIALIPTVHSEGTSLSALEAMASGCCVVASNVGGLPDIVIDEHNGLLIDPTSAALREAVVRLIESPRLRMELAERGKEVARCFSKDRWATSWEKLFQSWLPERPPDAMDYSSLPIVHLRAPGITWSAMKQRPHHICRALARRGHRVFFISDAEESADAVTDAAEHGVVLMRPSMELHLEEAILYYYYAYSTPDLLRAFRPDHPFAMELAVSTGVTAGLSVDLPRLWFDVLDHPEIHADRGYVDHFSRSIGAADVVTYSSEPLKSFASAAEPRAHPLLNGVFISDFSDIASSDGRLSRSQLAELGRWLIVPPASLKSGCTVLFYGAIAEWVDFRLLEEVAATRRVSLLMAGPIDSARTREAKQLLRRNNVHYLGVLTYEDLAKVARLADVGIVPFDLTRKRLVDAVLPLKMLEFLASGLPVISSRLAAVENLLAAAPAVVRQRVVWSDELEPDWPHRFRRRPGVDREFDVWLGGMDWDERVSCLPFLDEGGQLRLRLVGGTESSQLIQRTHALDCQLELEVPLSASLSEEAVITVDRPRWATEVRVELSAAGSGALCGGDIEMRLEDGERSLSTTVLDLLRTPKATRMRVRDNTMLLSIRSNVVSGNGAALVSVRARASRDSG